MRIGAVTIPDIPAGISLGLREYLAAVKQALDVLQGNGKAPEARRAPTLDEMASGIEAGAAAAVAPSAWGEWTALSLSNSWVTYGGSYPTPGWCRAFGLVALRGVIKDGTTGASAFTLPASARPAALMLVPTLCSGREGATLQIGTDGTAVVSLNSGGTNGWVLLDGVIFRHG